MARDRTQRKPPEAAWNESVLPADSCGAPSTAQALGHGRIGFGRVGPGAFSMNPVKAFWVLAGATLLERWAWSGLRAVLVLCLVGSASWTVDAATDTNY